MKLETQLEKLAELGLVLNPEIAIDDLLVSVTRQAFEDKPFELLLFCFGIEVERAPWGRRICNRVWSFDPECIVSTGDYVRIVQKLCLLSGDPDYLTDVVDYVDLDPGECWLEYTVRDKRQHWTIAANDDWADMLALSYVMEDLQRDGSQFYAIDNGEAMMLFYLNPETADKLSELCDDDLEPIIPS
jgi:hypothetical protein